MFEQIKRFMQAEDPNGDWLNATEEEAEYMLETLNLWIYDGLENTAHVQDYINYLKGLI